MTTQERLQYLTYRLQSCRDTLMVVRSEALDPEFKDEIGAAIFKLEDALQSIRSIQSWRPS